MLIYVYLANVWKLSESFIGFKRTLYMYNLFIQITYTNIWLTPRQLETHGCILSTIPTDAPVLEHQALSTNSAD